MLKRRKRQQQKIEEPEKDQPKKEGKKMEFTDLSVVLVFSTLFTVGGTLLGFIFRWFAHTYTSISLKAFQMHVKKFLSHLIQK